MSNNIVTITRDQRGRPYTGRQPAGRICESGGCTVVLSVYNGDTICHRCYEALPVEERPIAERVEAFL